MQIVIVCVLALAATISAQTFKDAVLLKHHPACKDTFATNKLLPVVPGNPCGATAAGCPYPDKMCTGEKKESGVCTDVPPDCKSKLSAKVAKDSKDGNSAPPSPPGQATTAATSGQQATTAAKSDQKATTAAMSDKKATTGAASNQKATTAGPPGQQTTAATAGKQTTAASDKPKDGKEITKDVTNTGGKVTKDVANTGVGVVSDIANGAAGLGRKKRNVVGLGRKL